MQAFRQAMLQAGTNPPMLTPQTYEEIKTALMEANALAAAIKEMEVMHAEEVAAAVTAIQREKEKVQRAEQVIYNQQEVCASV